MNCRDIQNQLTESSSFSKLNRTAQRHLEQCAECQGVYPTSAALKSLLAAALPELEPDPRLLASVRQSVYREMDKPAWGGLFALPALRSLSFAGGVAALFAVLALPLLWMDSSRPSAQTAPVLAQTERVEVQSKLAGPFKSADPLVVTDPLTSLHRAYRPKIEPGAVVHVIYPFDAQKKQQPKRSVVHY